jgi:hypothetical protein
MTPTVHRPKEQSLLALDYHVGGIGQLLLRSVKRKHVEVNPVLPG